MSGLDWQADDVLPADWLRYIGALRTYAQRMQFFFGVPNTLILVGYVLYDRAALLTQVFPTRFHWMAFVLFVVAPAVILFDRVLLHPAQITYNQHQNGHEDRSPNYRETMENQREINRLHRRLDELDVPEDTDE